MLLRTARIFTEKVAYVVALIVLHLAAYRCAPTCDDITMHVNSDVKPLQVVDIEDEFKEQRGVPRTIYSKSPWSCTPVHSMTIVRVDIRKTTVVGRAFLSKKQRSSRGTPGRFAFCAVYRCVSLR